MRRYLDRLRISLYTRRCNGRCGTNHGRGYHTHHLTALGRFHYLRRIK